MSHGVQLNPCRSHRNAKRSRLSSHPFLSIHFHVDSPTRLPADALLCSLAAPLSFLGTLFSKEKQHSGWGNRSATIETWHRSQKLDPRLLFFFKRSSLLVVAQPKRLPRQEPAEPWSVTAAQFLYSLHKSRGLLLNRRCSVNPSSEPFLLPLFS